jgi:hypothetical protein
MRQVFCDWHLPNFLPEITIDLDDYFENIARTGAECLIFQAKNAHGNCLYPTTVGVANQGMKGQDIFGDVCRRAKRMGLQFVAYYNVILSYELGRTHPEWQQVDQCGNRLLFEHYPSMCMSNDEFAEHVCDQMEEIARGYDIDGFFLDLQYFDPQGCYCESCRRRFEAQYGYPLSPTSLVTARARLDFINFKVAMRERFMRALQVRCGKAKPGLLWMWNHAGDPSFTARSLDRHATFMSGEAHPPEYLHADLRGGLMQATGAPFVLMMPESQGSWGDWTVTTVPTLKGLSALAIARRGALNVNHVPYPCGDYAGRVARPVWDATAETLAWVREREPWCTGKQPVPICGCPISETNIKLFQALSGLPGTTYWDDHLATIASLHQLLSELHLPLGFFHEEDAPEKMHDYELVVLPNLLHVSKAFAHELRTFVKQGGKLLATYQTSLLDAEGNRQSNFLLADLFGVDYEADSPYSVSYLDQLDPCFQRTVPSMPLLLKDFDRGDNPSNHALYCKLRPGARALGYLSDPVIESDFESGHFIYHQHSPPGTRTNYPAIVINHYVQGRVAFLPVPFLRAFRSWSPARGRSPFLKEVFRILLEEQLDVSKKIRVRAPASIKTTVMQDEEGWLLHLIHIQKESDSMYLEAFERVGPMEIWVNPEWPVRSVTECLSGKSFACRSDQDGIRVTVPSITDHLILRIAKNA